MALVLLAGGLLLLGGLLASVDPDDLAPTGLDAPRRLGEDPERTDRLEEFVGEQGITLVDDVKIEIPAGSSIAWDGDTLQVIGNVTLTIPKGTTFENLTIVLPEQTRLLPTDGSEAGRMTLVLAEGTRVRLPEEHDGRTFRLPEGGELRDHMIPLREQEQGIEEQDLTTRRFSLLKTPVAVLEDEWVLQLDGEARAELTAYAPLLDQMLDPERTYTNETLSLSAGEAPRDAHDENQGPDTEAVVPGGAGSPPPWWAWLIVVAVVAGVAVYTGARQMPALLRKPPAPHRAVVRLDDRPDDLPLATQADTPRTLHVRLVPRTDPRKGRDRRTPGTRPARLRVHLAGHGRIYKGRIGQEEVILPLPAMPEGDHEITICTRSSLIERTHRRRLRLRVAPWDEQIARDYQDLLEAIRAHLPGRPALTPRQCRELIERLDPADPGDPDAIVKAFEEANYSPKTVTEQDWVPFAIRVQRTVRAIQPRREAPTTPRHRRTPRPIRETVALERRPAG